MSAFRFAKSAALAAAMFCGLAAAAQAQTVLVVDADRVLGESTVGQYVQGQLTQIQQTIQNELQASAASLETDLQALQAQAQTMTPEALAADTALLQREADLNTRYTQLQAQQAQAQADMQATQAQAVQPILEQLSGILDALRAERQAAMILTASAVLAIDPNVDVTADVISRLNAAMTTTPVTRVNTAAVAQ